MPYGTDLFRQALARFRALEARQGEAAALDALGETLHASGQSVEALEHLTRALALEREIGDRGVEMLTLRNLALLHRDLGSLDQASTYVDQLHAASEHVGDRRAEPNAQRTAATIAQRRGEHRTAAEHYRRVLPAIRSTGYPYAEVDALIGLAEAYESLGETGLARSQAERAHDLSSRIGYALLRDRVVAILDRLPG